MSRHVWLPAVMSLFLAASATAEVARIEVTRREPFAGGMSFGSVGPYEKLVGRLHYRVDPRNPANARIVDLAHAPRDNDGRVVFVGDFVLLKPVDLSKGNQRLLYEVNNRGSLAMLARFNLATGSNDPARPEHAGNGFLMRLGYSLLWSAWNWDVLPGDGRLQIDLPVATDGGQPITGRLAAEIVVNDRRHSEPLAWGNSRCYPVADPADPSAVLTVRDGQRGARHVVPREAWAFARAGSDGRPSPDPASLWLDGGFEPGRIYELVYTARDPRVVGLSLAAIRDAISFFRFAQADRTGTPNPLAAAGPPASGAPMRRAYIFGISQSGRVIQHMVWQGFHVDESGRMVFDAAMPHVPGGGKGSFNHRFAQTTRHPSELEDHQYPADFFPFAPELQTDPRTGATDDVLAVAKALGKVPLVMYTGTSTEYWTRAASLVHTDVEGTRDAVLDAHVRLYAIAGGQHQNTRTSTRSGHAHAGNPLDHSAPLRALLVALDRWASDGTSPPPSRYPRIDRGELVTVAQHVAQFPKIPGMRHPGVLLQPPRLDFGPRFWTAGIADHVPPIAGAPYVTLVPAVDADGNERAGIRTPDVAVPLGTYTGWNPRGDAMGAPAHLARWAGSFFPLAPTEAARAAANDPRPSIEARYGSKEGYVRRVREEAERLLAEGFLLREDADGFVAQAEGSEWPPVAPGTQRAQPRPAAPAPGADLVGFATLPADTVTPGPPSGAFRDNGRRVQPFPAQPVQGVSSLVPDPDRPGVWLALSDNGFGVRWNSPDYLLAIYRLRPVWRTSAGGMGSVDVLEVIRLSDPDRLIPFRIVREDTTDRWLTGSDFDPESFVRMPDGSFWIGDEFGPFLLHVDASGRVLAPPVEASGFVSPDRPGLPPPDVGQPNPASVRRSRGFEGLAAGPGHARLLAMLEGASAADPAGHARVLEFDPAARAFTGRHWLYPLDAPEHAAAELAGAGEGPLLVIERDGGHGATARFKRVFAIQLGEPGGVVSKTLVVDLMAIANPASLAGQGPVFTFPFVTTEAVWAEPDGSLVLANDNNFPAGGGRTAAPDGTEFIRVRPRR